MSYEILRPLGDDPYGVDPWKALECLSRGAGWAYSNGQCVQAAVGGWGEVACKASGGAWDPLHGICCPAGQVAGPAGCESPETTGGAAVATWEEAACAVFGGVWNATAGACVYPQSSEGLVQQSRGGCAAGNVQTPDGRCLPMLPTQGAPESEPADGRTWWQRQPDSTKVMVVGGAAAAALVLLAVGVGAIGTHYTKNPPRKPRAQNPSTRRRHMTEPHYTGSFKDAWVIYDPSIREYTVKGPAPHHDRVAGVYRSRKAAFRKARSFTTAAEQRRFDAWLRRRSY